MTTPASINWKAIKEVGILGTLVYLLVTNGMKTNEANTEFFQGKFIISVEKCADSLSAVAVELRRKDDALEESAEAMQRFSASMDQLSERIQRLLTRGWENISSSNSSSKPPFVATPVSVQQ